MDYGSVGGRAVGRSPAADIKVRGSGRRSRALMHRLRRPHARCRRRCCARCSRPPAPTPTRLTDPSGFQLRVLPAVRERERRAGRDHDRAQPTRARTPRSATSRSATASPAARPSAPRSTGTTSPRSRAMLDFPVGVGRARRSRVPIVDHGVQSVPKTIQVSLFGPSPIGLASPSKAVLTIVDDDPVTPRDPAEPAGAAGRPDRSESAGRRQLLRRSRERAPRTRHSRIPALDVIAREPGTARFGIFSFGKNGVPDIGTAVSRYLDPRAGRVARHGAAAGHLPDPPRARAGTAVGLAGRRGQLPRLHRGLRAGHRLLPGGAVPRDGLDHHDAAASPPRPGGARARASATRSTS